MTLKKVLFLFTAMSVVLSLISCSSSIDLSSSKEESQTVMTVDGFEVPYEMYRYTVMMHMRDRANIILSEKDDVTVEDKTDNSAVIAAALGTLSDEEKKALADEVKMDSLESITDIYSLFSAAKKAGIDPFGANMNSLVEMRMEELRATYDSDKEYLSTLKLFFMNHSVYSMLTRYELVFEELYLSYVKDGTIDESDQAVIEYLKSDAGIRAKQILISFERHEESEARAIAEEVYEKLSRYIKDDGTVDEKRFDALTTEYGEDLFMFANTNGYYVCRGYLDENFEEAAFSLEVGHISKIIRTTAGYSIVLRAEKDPSFIESKVDALSEGCLTGIYRTILSEYSVGATVNYSDTFDEIDVISMK